MLSDTLVDIKFYNIVSPAKMAKDNITPNMTETIEIMRPATASPRGALNTPIREQISPTNHEIIPINGTQPKKIARSEKMKPTVPTVLLLRTGGM